jgi:hypothetical protein
MAISMLSLGSPSLGQAIPAASSNPPSTGFQLPSIAGTMSYSLSANETFTTGYYGGTGTDTSTGVNGNLALITASKLDPFSMVFAGGHYFSTSAEPAYSFLNLALSQVINLRRWNFILSDAVGYYPSTPSAGLSGIPGTGDLGVVPGVGPVQVGVDTGQGALTPYSTEVSETASVSASRHLTGKTSLQFSGNYNLLDFTGGSANQGLDSSGEGGSIGLSHAIDHRNTISGNYAYSNYSYQSNQTGFVTQTASLSYHHDFSRLLSMTMSAGPQWSSSSNNSSIGPPIPNSLNAYASVNLSYRARFASYTLSYFHGDNSGGGVLDGARSDSVSFTAARTFARVWRASFTSAYTRTTSLAIQPAGSTAPQTVVTGVQLSRALPHSFSTFASYTLEDQSTATGFDLFSGLFQVASFGLTYSPRPTHF